MEARQEIKIVNYEDKYKAAFRDLNLQWIEQYFKVEPADRKMLDNPNENILDSGGRILIALFQDEVVGVCALKKHKDHLYQFELSKMAIRPDHQGKGIGYILGNAIIDLAKELGAQEIFLESNTILKPAIHLYRKFGFEEVKGFTSPYERSNIQMVLKLS